MDLKMNFRLIAVGLIFLCHTNIVLSQDDIEADEATNSAALVPETSMITTFPPDPTEQHYLEPQQPANVQKQGGKLLSIAPAHSTESLDEFLLVARRANAPPKPAARKPIKPSTPITDYKPQQTYAPTVDRSMLLRSALRLSAMSPQQKNNNKGHSGSKAEADAASSAASPKSTNKHPSVGLPVTTIDYNNYFPAFGTSQEQKQRAGGVRVTQEPYPPIHHALEHAFNLMALKAAKKPDWRAILDNSPLIDRWAVAAQDGKLDYEDIRKKLGYKASAPPKGSTAPITGSNGLAVPSSAGKGSAANLELSDIAKALGITGRPAAAKQGLDDYNSRKEHTPKEFLSLLVNGLKIGKLALERMKAAGIADEDATSPLLTALGSSETAASNKRSNKKKSVVMTSRGGEDERQGIYRKLIAQQAEETEKAVLALEWARHQGLVGRGQSGKQQAMDGQASVGIHDQSRQNSYGKKPDSGQKYGQHRHNNPGRMAEPAGRNMGTGDQQLLRQAMEAREQASQAMQLQEEAGRDNGSQDLNGHSFHDLLMLHGHQQSNGRKRAARPCDLCQPVCTRCPNTPMTTKPRK